MLALQLGPKKIRLNNATYDDQQNNIRIETPGYKHQELVSLIAEQRTTLLVVTKMLDYCIYRAATNTLKLLERRGLGAAQ